MHLFYDIFKSLFHLYIDIHRDALAFSHIHERVRDFICIFFSLRLVHFIMRAKKERKKKWDFRPLGRYIIYIVYDFFVSFFRSVLASSFTLDLTMFTLFTNSLAIIYLASRVTILSLQYYLYIAWNPGVVVQ